MYRETFHFTYNTNTQLWEAFHPDTGETVSFEQGLVTLKHIRGVQYGGSVLAVHGVSLDQLQGRPPRVLRQLLGTPGRPEGGSRGGCGALWQLLPGGAVESSHLQRGGVR